MKSESHSHESGDKKVTRTIKKKKNMLNADNMNVGNNHD